MKEFECNVPVIIITGKGSEKDCSIIQWLNNLRIEKAKRLLQDSDLVIKEVVIKNRI